MVYRSGVLDKKRDIDSILSGFEFFFVGLASRVAWKCGVRKLKLGIRGWDLMHCDRMRIDSDLGIF